MNFHGANMDYEKQRRKTNQLRESASIIAGVAAVRNASPMLMDDEVGPVLFRITRPFIYVPFPTLYVRF